MMKKRVLSLFLSLCMIVGLLPVTTISAAAADAKYYTVEAYDADGNGTMLVAPTETTNWSGRYGTTFITSVLGSDNVTMSNDAVTGIKGADGEWLNNDGNSKWYIATDSNREVFLDSSYFYARNVTVLRFIYVPNGDFSKAGMDAGEWVDAYMKVEKGDLIKTLSAYKDETLGTNRQAAYDAGIAAIVDINATADDVAAAKTAMETAEDNAGSITLNKESTTLYQGQLETLTATLEPAGSTDELIWTSSDDSVVAVEDGVLKGMSAGKATVTVKAGTLGVTDTIEVTVNALQGLFVTKLNSNASATIEAQKESLTLAAFAEPEGIDNLDWQWNVEDSSIAKVAPMEGNEYIAEVTGKAEGTTNVAVTLGSMTSTFEVTVTPYQGPYVYFDFDDETKEDLRLDENNSITLTSLDAGNFRVANTNGSVRWSCAGNIPIYHPDYGEVQQYHTWINSETGRWTSSGTQPPTATVDTSDGFTQTFTIVHQEITDITELKTYVNGTEYTVDNPFTMKGTGRANVTTKGLLNGEWITIPQQALEYATSDHTGNIRILGNELVLDREGEATLTATVVGSNVSASFKARCEYVAVTGMEVIVPQTAYIHDWNVYNGYVGLLPNTGFQVNFTPENATNKGYRFEALTPDVATYMVEHNNGIVPKKPGTAKFKVYSADNENIYQEITINFEYKNKLTAATTEAAYTMTAGEKRGLTINTTPGNASEQRFNWSYSQNGIVNVESNITTDVGGTTHWTTHSMVAWAPGTVTVTGTPVDQTGGCQPIQFTVTVTGSGAEAVDHLALAKNDITHGLEYLAKRSMDEFGDEWTIFTTLRAGGTVSQADQTAYCASVKAKLDSGVGIETNDYVRLVLTLGAIGKDPTNFEGYNLVEKLYNNPNLGSQASNMVCWTLIALDSKNYTIPESAAWTRDKLIQRVLQFQIADGDNAGGFDLSVGGTTGSVDMTGMVLQSLAPYNNEQHADVQAAFESAQGYLKNRLTQNAGYVEGGTENSCTAAQVVVALCAAGIDPLNAENGYTRGVYNLITNLHSFRVDAGNGGFKTYLNVAHGDLMGSQQTTYALVAYQRFAENQKSLYDLTDVEVSTDYRTQLAALLEEANALKQADYTAETWSALETAKTAAQTTLDNESATSEQLKSAAEALSQAMAGLKKQSGSGGVVTPDDKITVTFRLIGAEKATQDVDMSKSDYAPKYVNWIKTTKYTVDKDSVVDDVFTAAIDKAGLTVTRKAGGNYIASITAPEVLGGYELGEFTNGARSGWMYTVNGIHVGYGLQEQTLEDGDVIIWHYINDYLYEDSQWAGGSSGNKDLWDKWLDAPDVNPTSGGSTGGSAVNNGQKADETVGTIEPKVTVSGNTATATITEKEMAATIENTIKSGGSQIKITVKETGTAGTVAVSIPTTGVKSMANETTAALHIESDKGSIVIPSETLKSIHGQLGNADLSVAIASKTAADVKDASVNTKNAVIVEVTISAGSKNISSFDGHALELSIPVNDQFKTGERYVVVEISADGSMKKLAGKCMEVDGKPVMKTETKGLSTFVVTTDKALKFTDVAMDAYCYDAVAWALEKGITSGTTDTAFAPNAACTRAQMVTFLWRAAGSPEPAAKANPFTDVKEDAYYFKALLWAIENGITNGTSETAFSPNAACTRGQMAAFLYRNAKTPAVEGSNPFADVKEADYYFNAVLWAAQNDVTKGTTETTFAPGSVCTRGQMVTFLYRYLAE